MIANSVCTYIFPKSNLRVRSLPKYSTKRAHTVLDNNQYMVLPGYISN